jgi:Coenzyme PQQ synthesis protein D (PqqD)
MTRFHRRVHGILVREVDRELLLLDTENDRVHQLNETASFVWRQVDDAGSAEEIAALMAGAYAADPAVLADDVNQILRRLVDMGLIIER